MSRASAVAFVTWSLAACAPPPPMPSVPAASSDPLPRVAAAATTNDPRCPVVPPSVESGNDHPDCNAVDLGCSWPTAPRCPLAKCAMSGIAGSAEPARPKWYVSLDMCAVECPRDKPAPGAPCNPPSNQVCGYAGGKKCGFEVRCTSSGWAEREITLCGGM